MRAINRIRMIFRELHNQKESRIEVGEDRFGNLYYQYYSFIGLPTRRECDYMDRTNFHLHHDNAFYDWTHKHKDFPPTEEELRL